MCKDYTKQSCGDKVIIQKFVIKDWVMPQVGYKDQVKK